MLIRGTPCGMLLPWRAYPQIFENLCIYVFALPAVRKIFFQFVCLKYDRIFRCGIVIDVGPIVCVDPKLASGADEKKPAYSKFE